MGVAGWGLLCAPSSPLAPHVSGHPPGAAASRLPPPLPYYVPGHPPGAAASRTRPARPRGTTRWPAPPPPPLPAQPLPPPAAAGRRPPPTAPRPHRALKSEAERGRHVQPLAPPQQPAHPSRTCSRLARARLLQGAPCQRRPLLSLRACSHCLLRSATQLADRVGEHVHLAVAARERGLEEGDARRRRCARRLCRPQQALELCDALRGGGCGCGGCTLGFSCCSQRRLGCG